MTSEESAKSEQSAPAPDPFGLQRFVIAQDAGGTYSQALAELRNGAKVSHWMWFVFPQLAGRGQSATSRHFAISGLDEARAYLAHPVLGSRLHTCASTLIDLTGRSAAQIFGAVDEQKLRSSMTLFASADPENPLFPAVLQRYFDGRPDARTLDLLRAG